MELLMVLPQSNEDNILLFLFSMFVYPWLPKFQGKVNGYDLLRIQLLAVERHTAKGPDTL